MRLPTRPDDVETQQGIRDRHTWTSRALRLLEDGNNPV
jgi:hypothetical protein